MLNSDKCISVNSKLFSDIYYAVLSQNTFVAIYLLFLAKSIFAQPSFTRNILFYMSHDGTLSFETKLI